MRIVEVCPTFQAEVNGFTQSTWTYGRVAAVGVKFCPVGTFGPLDRNHDSRDNLTVTRFALHNLAAVMRLLQFSAR